MSVKSPWLIMGSFLLVAICLLLWRQESGRDEVDSLRPPTKSENTQAPRDAFRTQSGHLLVEAPMCELAPSPGFPPDGKHRANELKDFHLPQVICSETTLAEAVQNLIATYNEVCLRTNQEPLEFYLKVPDDETRRLTFHLNGQSLPSALLSLATRYECVVEREGTKLTFRRPAEAVSEKLETKEWKTSKEFLFHLGYHLLTNDDAPFRAFPSDKSSHELLEEVGFLRAEGTSARFVHSTTTLIVQSSPEELRAIDFLVENLDGTRAHHRAETVILVSEEKLTSEGELTAEDFGDRLEEFRNQDGVMAEFLPPTEFSAHNMGVSSLMNEMPNEAEDPTGFITSPRWSGLQLSIGRTGYGFGFEHYLDFLVTKDDEIEMPARVTELFDGKVHVTESAIAPETARSLITLAGEDGGYRFLFTEVERVR
ncbi:MAG: hypothetical protein Q7Q71_03975 [Verrucomicrobiota bacterium JB023]|nr:hypothetical protein [Verrucomicrobiota bacterium JB023]